MSRDIHFGKSQKGTKEQNSIWEGGSPPCQEGQVLEEHTGSLMVCS